MRKTLYARLSPEAKEGLQENKLNCPYIVGELEDTLNANIFWSDLTINQISNLIIFTNSDFDFSSFDWRFGNDKLIKPENEVI